MGVLTPLISAREKAGPLDSKTEERLETLSGTEKRRYYRQVQRVNAKRAKRAAQDQASGLQPNARELFAFYMSAAAQLPDEWWRADVS